jgi:hypothetical protein
VPSPISSVRVAPQRFSAAMTPEQNYLLQARQMQALSFYGATGLSVGQRVFGLTDWTRDGTLAEYTVVEARRRW